MYIDFSKLYYNTYQNREVFELKDKMKCAISVGVI